MDLFYDPSYLTYSVMTSAMGYSALKYKVLQVRMQSMSTTVV